MRRYFFSFLTLKFKVLWFKWTKTRDRLIELVAVNFLFPVAGVIQPKSKGQLKIDKLLTMPQGSFGRELGEHMQHYKLEFIPGFEEHDMKHLLLGFPVSVPGEMRLSAFEFGTGNRSFMTLGVFLPAWFLAPEMWSQLRTDYERGKRNKQTRNVHLKSMIQCPIAEVLNQLKLQ